MTAAILLQKKLRIKTKFVSNNEIRIGKKHNLVPQIGQEAGCSDCDRDFVPLRRKK